MLRCLLVARKENLTGISTGLTGRSKNLYPTGNPTGFQIWSGDRSINICTTTTTTRTTSKNHLIVISVKSISSNTASYVRSCQDNLVNKDVMTITFHFKEILLESDFTEKMRTTWGNKEDGCPKPCYTFFCIRVTDFVPLATLRFEHSSH